MKYSVCFFLAIMTVALWSGCSKSEGPTSATNPADTAAVSAHVQQAYGSMESEFDLWFNNKFHNATDFDRLNFQNANAAYKEALRLDPSNREANFGAGITEVLTAYADTEINSSVKRWESYINSHPFSGSLLNTGIPLATQPLSIPLLPTAINTFEMFAVALDDPPLISEIQATVRNRLLPRIDYAIARLAVVEQDSLFKFKVSGKMQGDSSLLPVYLYITEIYLTDAGLQAARMGLESFLMYSFDLPDYSQSSLVNALQQDNTSFLVLAPDGATRAQDAKNAFQTFLDKTTTGIHFLETFSGHRNDAAVKIGTGRLKQESIDSAKVYIQRARNSLAAPIDLVLKRADTEGNDYTIQVYLAEWFDNPPQNPKSQFFPAYTVSPSGTRGVVLKFSAQTYADFSFPDPTFHGLLPGMTNDRLKRILRIDQQFGFDWRGYAFFRSYQDISYATVKIQTALHTYTRLTDQFGSFRFVITDADYESFRLYIDYGNGDVELESADSMVITPKTKDYRRIDIPPRPQNLALSTVTSPLGVQLSWDPQYPNSDYAIQRAIGSGTTPSDYDSAYFYQSGYVDYNVTSGTTYRYRLRTLIYFSPFSYSPKDPLYSEIQDIVP